VGIVWVRKILKTNPSTQGSRGSPDANGWRREEVGPLAIPNLHCLGTGVKPGDAIYCSMLLFALLAAVIALFEAVLLLAKRKSASRSAKSAWRAPVPDPDRYQVVFHLNGETRELYHGYDGLKARHAFENAPMEAGMTVEFYEWGAKRGEKVAP
jgi:hypothetical protein